MTWRCQASHWRTSYWSSPTAFARSKPSSTTQRVPATRTSSFSGVRAGPKQTK